MSQQLSEHFSEDEFTHSQSAARLGVDNSIPDDLLPAARNTARNLELVRELLGNKPLNISSGFRNSEVNRAVGGSPNSQHLRCEAVDFTCRLFGTPDDIVRAIMNSDIRFDQVIREFDSWVHISFSFRLSNPNRRQALIIDKTGTRKFV